MQVLVVLSNSTLQIYSYLHHFHNCYCFTLQFKTKWNAWMNIFRNILCGQNILYDCYIILGSLNKTSKQFVNILFSRSNHDDRQKILVNDPTTSDKKIECLHQNRSKFLVYCYLNARFYGDQSPILFLVLVIRDSTIFYCVITYFWCSSNFDQ